MGVAPGGRAPAVPRIAADRLFLRGRPRYHAAMRPRSIALLAVASLLVACRSTDPGLPPARIVDLPWGDGPVDRAVRVARDAFERGEPVAALGMLDAVLAEHPRDVDALRLRQDILRQRGRRGVLLCEAQAALAARPDDGLAHYLAARITDDPVAKLRGFQQAALLARESLWPWLGLAHTVRQTDVDQALAIYERLYAASDRHPLVGIAYAAALRDARRFDAAARVYDALRGDERLPGVGDLGLAQTAIARDDRATAWAALLQALRTRPFDPGVQALVHGWLETSAGADQAEQVLDVLREDPKRFVQFGSHAGAPVLAALLAERGQPLAARSLLERQLETAPSPALRRVLRRLLLSVGDVDAFVVRMRADVPRAVVEREQNQLRGRWLSLLDGPWRDGPALATPERAEALLVALRDVGWLAEVELLAEVALARWPGRAPAFAALRDEARRELAFEAGLRRLLYQGYQARDTADLATVVERLRGLSQRVLGRDVVGRPERYTVPLVGELLDPFTGELADHLARYNRHLVLGRRSGGVAEGLLVTRLSVAELPQGGPLPLPARCFGVIGIDRDVKALAGVLGGDLAGVALLNHFLLDYDAVVDWAQGIADRRRVARADGLALLKDPLPADAAGDPLDVAWRLSIQSPVADADLDAAVLEMIGLHERQHLVDSHYYLPIEANLWRGLGLLFGFAFSPAAIEAEMERRAELAALVHSQHTGLVLAHIVDFVGEPPLDSPHHRGFGALAAQLRAELVAGGVPAEQAVPSRWHTLDGAQLRAAARRLLEHLPR